jgi:hypothetical protein
MALRFWRHAALYVVLTLGVLFSPVVNCSSVTQAQTSVSVEFRTSLEPHGRWSTHQRWGEVWTPTRSAQDWRPYKIGRWVYSDEWGWYWDSNEEFGLIVYHYGRWVFERDLGWVWVPGREWGPGWVNWRRGTQHVGWSPLPPDDIVADYWEEPDVWVFVRAKDLTAPRIATVVLPAREQTVVFRETVVVNRTVVVRDRGVAVNPGIPPAIIAAAVGRPIRAVEVRPAVLAGTAQIPGAVEFRADEFRRGRTAQTRVTIRETTTTIRPADRVPPPQPLAKGEQGRLGDTPPRAARATPGQPAGAPGTPTTTQDQRQPGPPATTQDQRQRPDAPATTQDQRQQPGAPATTQDQRQRPGAPTTSQDQRQPRAPEATEDRRQRPGAPVTTRDQRQRPDRPDAAQDQRQRPDRPDSAQDQRQQSPAGTDQDRRQHPPASAQEQRQQRDRPDAAQDQRQQRGRDAARERQPGGAEGRSPPAGQRPDAQPAARPERQEGQRSEQRGEQRGQQGAGQQQRPAAGQRPGRGPQEQGEKKEDKKDER